MSKVLIVEDDQTLAVALRDGLQYEGHSVLSARDGMTGLNLASERELDIVLLDVMLPKMSGLDVCKRLRSKGNNVPIILLTARGQEIDRVLGLKLGADDYVTKPFSFLELMARLEAVLRRSSRPVRSLQNFQFDNITVDFKSSTVLRDNQTLDLSHREFRILKYFIEHRGEVVSRDQLLNAVWGYDSFPITRTVDTHIAKLRQKIELLPSEPRYIVTVHRAGYKFTG